jgi:hypothetical protein
VAVCRLPDASRAINGPLEVRWRTVSWFGLRSLGEYPGGWLPFLTVTLLRSPAIRGRVRLVARR